MLGFRVSKSVYLPIMQAPADAFCKAVRELQPIEEMLVGAAPDLFAEIFVNLVFLVTARPNECGNFVRTEAEGCMYLAAQCSLHGTISGIAIVADEHFCEALD